MNELVYSSENIGEEMHGLISDILYAYDTADSSTKNEIEKFFKKFGIDNGQDTDKVVDDSIKSKMTVSDAIDFASEIDVL